MTKLSLALLICVAALSAPNASAAAVDTVVLFNPAAFETPESIQFDRHGNAYVSLALTGEVRKIAPDGVQTTLAFMPIRPDVQPCQNGFGLPLIGGLALDHQGNVYVSVASCNAPDLGVWKVTPQGQISQLAVLPPGGAPNGIAYHGGWLYFSDSFGGAVYRVHTDGNGPAQLWTNSALLAPVPLPLTPGPNGVQVFHDEVYVAVSDRAHVVAFPFFPGPDPRRPSILRFHVGVAGKPRP